MKLPMAFSDNFKEVLGRKRKSYRLLLFLPKSYFFFILVFGTSFHTLGKLNTFAFFRLRAYANKCFADEKGFPLLIWCAGF